jgi:periplasmic divalent cation tolerance protein
MANDYVIALSTLPASAGPPRLARMLVEERLAACVNILPAMTSIYRWKGGVEQEPEHQLLMKTTRERVPALWDRLRELHPYDVPEFVVIPILDGNGAYLNWIAESTARPA